MRTKTRTKVAAPDPLESLTLQFETEDGQFITETVSLDFSEVPPDVMFGITYTYDPHDIVGITAAVLQSKLETEVPIEVLKTLIEDLNRGEGVTPSPPT